MSEYVLEISKKAIRQLTEHTESTATVTKEYFYWVFSQILTIPLHMTLLCYCFNIFFSPFKLLIIKAHEDFSNICGQKYM